MAKLSVALCTYNGAAHLEEQLTSVAEQSRPPDELVVGDDASGDRTVDMLREFAAASAFPVLISVNESRLGSNRNYEKTVALCSGELIALADQDDYWRSDKLEILESALLARPSAGAVFSNAEMVDRELRPLGYDLWSCTFPEPDRRKFLDRKAFEVLAASNVVTGATMMFRAELRDLFTPIPPAGVVHDRWIALLAAAVGEIIFVDQLLVKYRQHPAQQLGARLPRAEGADGHLTVAAKLRAHARAAREWRAAGRAQEQSELELACRHVETKLDMFGRRTLSELQGRIEHLRARGALPDAKLRRVLPVIKELSARRYHLYSKGFYSAAKDVIF